MFNFDSVPIGGILMRTTGKRKGFKIRRIDGLKYGDYPGPMFEDVVGRRVYEDWDLPADDDWVIVHDSNRS